MTRRLPIAAAAFAVVITSCTAGTDTPARDTGGAPIASVVAVPGDASTAADFELTAFEPDFAADASPAPTLAAPTPTAPTAPTLAAPTPTAPLATQGSAGEWPASTTPPQTLPREPATVPGLPEPVVAGHAALIEFGAAPHDRVVVVDPSSQKLFVATATELLATFDVSTGASGLSGILGSGGTPVGALQVQAVLHGAVNETFKYASPTGKIVPASPAASGPAYMTTTVFTLVGLETHNKSSRQRGIYIHGTNLEGSLGKPLSAGCVRVSNATAVALRDLVPPGALMYILERRFQR